MSIYFYSFIKLNKFPLSQNYQRCQFTVAQPLVKPSKEDVVQILRTCQAVCFDVDSTVIPEEGIDELASFKGVGSDVAAWTTQYETTF